MIHFAFLWIYNQSKTNKQKIYNKPIHHWERESKIPKDASPARPFGAGAESLPIASSPSFDGKDSADAAPSMSEAERRGEASFGKDSTRRGESTFGKDSTRRGESTFGKDSTRRGESTFGKDSTRRGESTFGKDSTRRGESTFGKDSCAPAFSRRVALETSCPLQDAEYFDAGDVDAKNRRNPSGSSGYATYVLTMWADDNMRSGSPRIWSSVKEYP